MTEWQTVGKSRRGPVQASNTMGDYIGVAMKSSSARDLCSCRGSGAGSCLPTDELADAKPSEQGCMIPVKNRFEGLFQENETAYIKNDMKGIGFNDDKKDFNRNEPQITDDVDALADEDRSLIDGFVQNFDLIHACGVCKDGGHD